MGQIQDEHSQDPNIERLRSTISALSRESRSCQRPRTTGELWAGWLGGAVGWARVFPEPANSVSQTDKT